MPEWLTIFGYAIIILASLTATVLRNWRFTLIALAVQYLGITIILSFAAPIGIAIIKLIVGWMSCAVMGITCMSIKQLDLYEGKNLFSRLLFRAVAAILIFLVVLSLMPGVSQTFLSDIPDVILLPSFSLLALGLLQLGMTTSTFYAIAGLLTFFSGFELLYSVLESSSLVVGLLAVVNMGLVSVGAFILINEQEENNI
ncbi:MAG: hypothetical protein MUO40_02110 [Anaerolineaceae bacterium]|nr:hypothetical protein [Anaerolineaceae bacterium]